jgi:hypothetical protein
VACPALLQHTFPRLQDEKPQPLCQYSGKVLLVVNTASFCGFTPQYEGLEKLHAKYKDAGLVVLGFPSNDFAQETGSNKEIADFCENTFGVKFPMFARPRARQRRQSAVPAAGGANRPRAAVELPQVPDRPRRQGGGQLQQPDAPGRPGLVQDARAASSRAAELAVIRPAGAVHKNLPRTFCRGN